MDRILRRQLRRIEADERAGATELTRRAVEALQQWLQRSPRSEPEEYLAVAKGLLRTQPSMGPTFRLANLAALAADSLAPSNAFAESLFRFQRTFDSALRAIPKLFARACKRWTRIEIHTYSYSSTVAASLKAARSSIERVECSESRPGLEGRRLVSELADAGISVCFMTDAELLDQTRVYGKLLVLGADAVMPGHLVNKVGSGALVQNFAERRRPVWVLCDTTKFRLGDPFDFDSGFWADTHGNPRDFWKSPPETVHVHYSLLDAFPFQKGVRVLTERGWMNRTRVRREIAKIRLSPRLKELVD